MMNDIKPAEEMFEDDRRTLPPHNHYWTVATIKNSFEPTDTDGNYQMVEYAFLLCKCTAVVKTKVTSKEK